jgi:hypothetical protein
MGTAGLLRRSLDVLMPAPGSRQVRSEFRSFLQLLTTLNVRSYLEVGAYRGGTFYRVMRALPAGALGVTVDNGRRSASRGRPSPLAEVGARLARQGYAIETIFGDSRDGATIEAARRLGPYDAILIDGDHSYDGVKHDWEAYGPMARRLVAFHDVAEEHVTRSGFRVEVPRLWREIKAAGANTREFVAPGSKMGIGVVVRS